MVLEYMDRGTAQHLSKEGLLDLEGMPASIPILLIIIITIMTIILTIIRDHDHDHHKVLVCPSTF